MDFPGLLAAVAERPGMYVGSCSLPAIAHLLDGYCLALEHLGHPAPLRGWVRWLECRFGISHPAWHWTRILLHAYGTQAGAIAALLELFRLFETEQATLGVEGIETRHDREFLGKGGLPQFRVPKETAKVDPSPDQATPRDERGAGSFGEGGLAGGGA